MTQDSAEGTSELEAAKVMDWQQVVMNGGPPCFHIGDDGITFCGRAERWDGHKKAHVIHEYVSLHQLIDQALRRERNKVREECAKACETHQQEYTNIPSPTVTGLPINKVMLLTSKEDCAKRIRAMREKTE